MRPTDRPPTQSAKVHRPERRKRSTQASHHGSQQTLETTRSVIYLVYFDKRDRLAGEAGGQVGHDHSSVSSSSSSQLADHRRPAQRLRPPSTQGPMIQTGQSYNLTADLAPSVRPCRRRCSHPTLPLHPRRRSTTLRPRHICRDTRPKTGPPPSARIARSPARVRARPQQWFRRWEAGRRARETAPGRVQPTRAPTGLSRACRSPSRTSARRVASSEVSVSSSARRQADQRSRRTVSRNRPTRLTLGLER